MRSRSGTISLLRASGDVVRLGGTVCKWLAPPNENDVILERVLADCTPTVPMRLIPDGTQIRAHIALLHKVLEEYRGYLLLSDPQECVALISLNSRTYVRTAKGPDPKLVLIDGLCHAKLFVDRLSLSSCSH